jgi:hypothetical protein
MKRPGKMRSSQEKSFDQRGKAEPCPKRNKQVFRNQVLDYQEKKKPLIVTRDRVLWSELSEINTEGPSQLSLMKTCWKLSSSS